MLNYDGYKDIKVGFITLLWDERKRAWAIHGRSYEANERKARELARRMNNAITKGKKQ